MRYYSMILNTTSDEIEEGATVNERFNGAFTEGDKVLLSAMHSK